MDYVIGCDVGTQSVKAVLLSLGGKFIGEASACYDVFYPYPLWAEQQAQDWLKGLETAIAVLQKVTGFTKNQVQALGIAAQVDGVVPVDQHGKPLRNAIIWMDRRATAQCEAISATGSATDLFNLSGLNLDPSHVAPKIQWLAEQEPQVYEQAAYFLLPGSYLAYALTGQLAVDYSNASSTLLMNVRQRTWSTDLCQRFGIDRDRLAPIQSATGILGQLLPDRAEALGLSPQTQVMVGCGDEHAACLGAGVLQAGPICDIAGTAEPVCAASPTALFDSTGLVETHCHADPALWLIENPGFVSGANYRWFCNQFTDLNGSKASPDQQAYQQLNQEAANVAPGSEGLILLPCLMGAMTPTWNANARGTFFGFTLAHRRKHFVRAILESSAYALRDITDRMQQMGVAASEIRVVGGGARDPLWRQIKSDVTGLPVALPQTVETTALGAAMLALVGVGAYASLTQAADAMVKIVDVLEPRTAVQACYESYYQLYRSTYQALLPVFEQAAQLQVGAQSTPIQEG